MRPIIPLLVLTAAASACDNPFGYSYIPETQKPGELEFEQYVTARFGRDVGAGYEARYRGFDLETELEYGLTPKDQVSLELNHSYLDSSVREGFRFQGINLGYKHMFADPEKQAWGHSLYFEVGYVQAGSSDGLLREAYSAEVKYIYQHNFGANNEWIYVGNLITEVSHVSGVEDAVEFKLTQGLAREIGKHWMIGVEAVAEAEWVEMNDFEAAGLLVGPVVSYRNGSLTASLTFLAQVVGSPQDKGSLNVSEFSPYEARLRFAYEF